MLQNCCHLKWTGKFQKPMLQSNSGTHIYSLSATLLRMDFVRLLFKLSSPIQPLLEWIQNENVQNISSLDLPPSSLWLSVSAFDGRKFYGRIKSHKKYGSVNMNESKSGTISSSSSSIIIFIWIHITLSMSILNNTCIRTQIFPTTMSIKKSPTTPDGGAFFRYFLLTWN